MAEKFYAVKQGRKTGIFTSWEQCRAQVHGFAGAKYKSFPTRAQAEEFMGESSGPDSIQENETAAYVDGSYDKNTGAFSYGMVILSGDRELTFNKRFEKCELSSMHNVAGEIMGAAAAMSYALENGIDRLVIYHDYEGIAAWCLRHWKANKEGTIAYRDFYDKASEKIRIRFKKVTGHSGDKYNDYADRLAKDALGL